MFFFSFALNQSYKKSPLLFTASKNLRTFTFYTRLNKELLFKETICHFFTLKLLFWMKFLIFQAFHFFSIPLSLKAQHCINCNYCKNASFLNQTT